MISSWRREVRSCSYHHFFVFFLTFFGYAFFHATRKTFSNVKDTLKEEWTPSPHNESVPALRPLNVWNSEHMFSDGPSAESFLSILDMGFLIAYAVGLYISGAIGDRFNIRYVLAIGMTTSAVAVFLFGCLSGWLHIYSEPYYIIFWVLNGLLQSLGWPSMIAVMGNWFGRGSRGLVLGIWSSCASVGNIIGSLISGAVLPAGYEYTFLVPAAILFAWGIVTFFSLVPKPSEVGLASPDEDDPAVSSETNVINEEDEEERPLIPSHNTENNKERPKAVGFIQAFLLPGVLLYALSYACLKMVNYAFFFWLPYYLTNRYGWTQSTADDLSIWYDVGGIAGGITGGLLSDFLRRAPVVEGMLVLALPSLWMYNYISATSMSLNGFLLSVVGFFIGGPATLISSAIAADLGRQEPIRGNKEALATVTGIIDGTGSVGAAIGQLLIPVFHQHFSWQAVFYLFIILTVLTGVCILPVLINEIKSMRAGCRQQHEAEPEEEIQENYDQHPGTIDPAT